MSKLARPALFAALTAAGLVLLTLGTWFTLHLGVSGTATFRTTTRDGVVVVEPSVLNRVDGPVTVTARGARGQQLFLGVATPADAEAIVGGAQRTTVTGMHVQDWSLHTAQAGAGSPLVVASADIWRGVATGVNTVHLTVTQAAAPETMVVARQDGKAPELSSLTVTMNRSAWFVESLVTALVGLLALLAGAYGFWRDRSRTTAKEG